VAPNATGYQHIVLDERGFPFIAGTTLKVVQLVEEKIAHGSSPEELHFQHPYLTLGQIHSALAYYFDHREDLDRAVEERLRFADRLRVETQPPDFLRRIDRTARD